MNKMFDALKRMALSRTKRKDTKIAWASIAEYTDRRLTSRSYVKIPVFIYGYTPRDNPFYEESCTISINGTGGLISMTSSVQPGQRLVVTNQLNDQTQDCVVVSVEAQPAHGSYIALKFPTSIPQFWRELEIGKCPAL